MTPLDPNRPRSSARASRLPRDPDGPVFREPWEAQAFAMTLALHERGLFTWPEWAAALAAEIKRAQAAATPTPARPTTGTGSCARAPGRRQGRDRRGDACALPHAWDHAADRTPHGQPIELHPSGFHERDEAPEPHDRMTIATVGAARSRASRRPTASSSRRSNSSPTGATRSRRSTWAGWCRTITIRNPAS